MASAMRKMAVYLGLVEDDRYDDEYDEYDIYDDEAADRRRVERADDESSVRTRRRSDQREDDEQKAFARRAAAIILPSRRCQTLRVSLRFIPGPTTRPARSESTSGKGPR